jgi:hypothetical protein
VLASDEELFGPVMQKVDAAMGRAN